MVVAAVGAAVGAGMGSMGLQMAAVSAVYTGLALHNVGSQRLSCGIDYAFSGPAFPLVILEINHISWL